MTDLVTKTLQAVVRRMSGGDTFQVTNCKFVSNRLSGSVFARLKKLGWVNVDRQFAFGNTYRTLVTLNEIGMRRASEFAAISEANCS